MSDAMRLPAPYYDDGQITIYHGDAHALCPALPVGAFDCVITDPPYGVELTAKSAKRRGGGVVRRAGTYAAPDTPEYIASVIVPTIAALIPRSQAVALTPGVRCMWLYPEADDVGCFFSAAGTGMSRWGFTGMQPILYYGSDPFLRTRQGSRSNSCGQTYPNDANQVDHPCAKPLKMWRWLVARASLEGETILDPFMGSGTTLLSGRALGRRVIGIDNDLHCCEVAVARLRQALLPFPAIPRPQQATLELAR